LDEEAFNRTDFFSLFLRSSSLDFSRRISCSLRFLNRVVIPRVLRFWDSYIAVTMGCQSLVMHLNTFLVQSWFEMSFPMFCNLLTICVNLICMKKMNLPSSMWKSSYCYMRVLIFDCLTSSVPSWKVFKASHITVEVLQCETEWYSFTPREEISMFLAFILYLLFVIIGSIVLRFVLHDVVNNNVWFKPPIGHDVPNILSTNWIWTLKNSFQ